MIGVTGAFFGCVAGKGLTRERGHAREGADGFEELEDGKNLRRREDGRAQKATFTRQSSTLGTNLSSKK